MLSHYHLQQIRPFSLKCRAPDGEIRVIKISSLSFTRSALRGIWAGGATGTFFFLFARPCVNAKAIWLQIKGRLEERGRRASMFITDNERASGIQILRKSGTLTEGFLWAGRL